MWVKLNFEDGTSECMDFHHEDLLEMEVWDSDEIKDYLAQLYLNVDDMEYVSDLKFLENKGQFKKDNFDVRNYENHHFVGKTIDNKVVISYSFPAEDSYEYSLFALSQDDPYIQWVEITSDYPDERFPRGYINADPYDDDPGSD